VQTALSNTTISGYVSASANVALTDNYATSPAAGIPFQPTSKENGFNLDVVKLSISKPEDEGPWASGYKVDLLFGPDAVGYNTSVNTTSTADYAIKQAYVNLRTPVGNGIDWKIGVMDDIIGYEGNTDGGNPNYTRSVGYALEPTTLTGLVGSYQVCKAVTVQAGIADATSGNGALSSKTFVGAVALTAPDNWGWAKGATANLGTVLNLEPGGQNNFYAGVTVPTPWSMLKVGGALDLASVANEVPPGPGFNPHNDSGWDISAYANVQATDKLSFNLRGEFFDLQNGVSPYGFSNGVGEEVTATAQYNLWANVISRVEFRWDHVDEGEAFAGSQGIAGGGVGPATADSFLLAVNLIYTF